MVKRYYAMIDANTGKTDVRHEEWDNIKTEFQSKSSLIYKVFNTEKEANDFINQGYIEESDIDPDDNEAVNKEIEDCIASLTDDEAIIATDGSYMEDVNKDIAGAGWIEITKDHKEPKNDTCAPEGMRNVAGEIKAIEKGIEWARSKGFKRLDIYFDYAGLVGWAYGYNVHINKKNDKGKNDLRVKYYNLIKETSKHMKLVFHKVSAHTNVKYNEEADRLAKEAVENYGK